MENMTDALQQWGLDRAVFDEMVALATSYSVKLVGGLLVLVIGWRIASIVGRHMQGFLIKRGKLEQTLAIFLSSLARYAMLAIVIIAVLDLVGVQTASLVAVFGAAGLAIGLALQGTLSNVAAGVMLMIFRPVKVGQYVEVGGQAGTVTAVTLFTTELDKPDGVHIILPNSMVWGNAVVNYSFNALRRADFVNSIAYDDDIDKAMAVFRRVIDNDSRCLQDPAPQIIVGALSASSVDIWVRVWVKQDDFWDLKFDLTQAFKLASDDAGLTIPFPQSDVHLYQVAGKTAPSAASAD